MQDSGFREQAGAPVDAAGGDVVEFGGELGGGERAVAEERPEDAQPHRVQQQIGGCDVVSVN